MVGHYWNGREDELLKVSGGNKGTNLLGALQNIIFRPSDKNLLPNCPKQAGHSKCRRHFWAKFRFTERKDTLSKIML